MVLKFKRAVATSVHNEDVTERYKEKNKGAVEENVNDVVITYKKFHREQAERNL